MTKICWRINLTVFVGNSLFGFLIKYPRYPATLFQLLSSQWLDKIRISARVLSVYNWSPAELLKTPLKLELIEDPQLGGGGSMTMMALLLLPGSSSCSCGRIKNVLTPWWLLPVAADVNTNYILPTPRPVALTTPAPADTGAADGSRRTGAGRWRRMVRLLTPDSRLRVGRCKVSSSHLTFRCR